MNASQLVKCGHLWIHPLYTKSSSITDMASDIVVCVVNIILAILATIGNASVILAYMKNTNLQTKNNLLIVALAMTDLVAGAWAQPSFVWVKISEMGGTIDCNIEIINDLTVKFCVSVSLLILGVIVSGERYFAVFYPLKHRAMLTKRKLLGATVIVWVGVALFVISIPFGIHYTIYQPIGLTFIVISLCFSVGLYIKIAKKLSRMKSQTMPFPLGNIDPRSCSQVSGNIVAIRTSTTQQIKYAMTLFYVLSALCVTYFPMISGFIYVAICGQDVFYQKFLWTWGVTFLFFNSFCNPLIYSWRNRYMSSAIRRLFVWKRTMVIEIGNDVSVIQSLRSTLRVHVHALRRS